MCTRTQVIGGFCVEFELRILLEKRFERKVFLDQNYDGNVRTQFFCILDQALDLILSYL